MRIVNRFCLVCTLFLISCTLSLAQSQSLEFIYIAHDSSTPVSRLSARLQEVFNDARSNESNAVIFYLANADEPRIVKMNLPDANPQDFEEMLGELNYKSAHEIYAEVDRERIVQMFDETDFILDNGQPAFSMFTMTYYVNPSFWAMKYNENVIASLYFMLDLNRLPSDYFTMEIWHGQDDGLVYDEKAPFGERNLCSGYRFYLLGY